MSKERESRKGSLRDRQQKSYKEKDGSGFNGKSIFRLDEIGVEPKKLFYSIKEGKNLIDIIPFVVRSNNNPHTEKGKEDYVLDIWVHRNVGPAKDEFVCLNRNFKQNCPICEEIDRMKADGADNDELKGMWPSRRVYYNVIDLLSEEEEIQILGAGHNYFEKELQETSSVEEEIVIFAEIDVEEGRSIFFRGSEKTFPGGKWIEPKGFSFKKRKAGYEEAVIDEAFPLDELLHIPTYDEVVAAFYGQPQEESEESEENTHTAEVKEDELPVKKRRRRTVGATEDDSDDQEEVSPAKEERPPCPHNHKFAVDFEKYESCDKCDLWDGCGEENDKLGGGE